MIEVTKKENENFDSLMKRFTRRFFESGLKLEVNRKRFRPTEPNKNRRKDTTLRRLDLLDQVNYEIKIGRRDPLNPFKK